MAPALLFPMTECLAVFVVHLLSIGPLILFVNIIIQ